MSRDIEDQLDRDAEKEPHAIRRHARLDARGTLRIRFEPPSDEQVEARAHGAECPCAWCQECPETEAALSILRRGGLL